MAKNGICLAAATLAIAILTPVLEPPRSMLRPFWSAHSRNFEAPISGLFWWSALSRTILRPRTEPPKSAIAIRVASTAPAPATSAYTPEKSSRSPITIWSAAAATREFVAALSATKAPIAHMPGFIALPSIGLLESDAQNFVQHDHLPLQLRRREALHDPTMLHDVEAVRKRRSEAEVLLRHHDGVASLAQRLDGSGQSLHDDRSEPLGDL